MQAGLYTGASHMGGKGFDTRGDVVPFDDWAKFGDLWPAILSETVTQ